MGKSKWFCPTAKPRPDHILKKYFKIFLKLTAMVETQTMGEKRLNKKIPRRFTTGGSNHI